MKFAKFFKILKEISDDESVKRRPSSLQYQQFSSATIIKSAQKKILSKIISRNNVKFFVGDATIRLFDHIYQILKVVYNKITAEKVSN